eukprot:jgi/Mesen1/9469/ME000063S08924
MYTSRKGFKFVQWMRPSSSVKRAGVYIGCFLFLLGIALSSKSRARIPVSSRTSALSAPSDHILHRSINLPFMGPTLLEVDGPDQFVKAMATLDGKSDVFVLFLGNNLAETGESWCPDCRAADPVISKVFGTSPRNMTLVRVYVGDKPTWKDPLNPFRSTPYRVTGVPTLARWESGKIAEGALGDLQAQDEKLVRRLLESSPV